MYSSKKSGKNLYTVYSGVIFLNIEQIFPHLNRDHMPTKMCELYISTPCLNKTILKPLKSLELEILCLRGVSSIASSSCPVSSQKFDGSKNFSKVQKNYKICKHFVKVVKITKEILISYRK